MNTWLILKIIFTLLVLGGIGLGIFLYFLTQNSPSIIGNDYDKKMKKESEKNNSQKGNEDKKE